MTLPDSAPQVTYLKKLIAHGGTSPKAKARLSAVLARLEGARVDYEVCEAENVNLRHHLRWAVERLTPELRAEMAEALAPSIEDGGIVSDLDPYQESLEELLRRIAEHFERCVDAAPAMPPAWHFKAEYLLNQARGYGPKSPMAESYNGAPRVVRMILRSK